MKLSTFTFSALALLSLTSCMTVPTGNGPSISNSQLALSPAAEPQDITFSLEFNDDMGPDSWFDEEEIIKSVREKFTASGLFRRVAYVHTDQMGPKHYHFKVRHSGTSMDTRVGLGLMSGCTLMTIPIWVTSDLDWSMFAFNGGNEVYSLSSNQSCKDVLWLPLVIGTPFFNHATMGGSMKTGALNYFLSEISKQESARQ